MKEFKLKKCPYCKETIQYTEDELTASERTVTRGGALSTFKNLVCPNCNNTISWQK